MKVSIPANPWMTEAELDFFKEGVHQGTYGLTLTFSGESLDSLELLTEILSPLTSLTLPAVKVVRLKGLFSRTDPLFGTFVKALIGWGFRVNVILDASNIDAPWIQSVNWITLLLSKPFAPIASNEVWYTPVQTDGPIIEPRLPNPENTLLYIHRTHSPAATIKFITSSKNVWRLL